METVSQLLKPQYNITASGSTLTPTEQFIFIMHKNAKQKKQCRIMTLEALVHSEK